MLPPLDNGRKIFYTKGYYEQRQGWEGVREALGSREKAVGVSFPPAARKVVPEPSV